MSQSVRAMLSYRNGYYQGQVRQRLRSGSGLLLVDEGPLLVAQWKQDLAFGPAFCFLSSEEHCFLEFNRGELEGVCLFRAGAELLVMQFNNGRPVDRQLLLNHEEGRAKVLAYRNANYEVLETVGLGGRGEGEAIEELLGVRVEVLPVGEYLQRHFCNSGAFEARLLPNGTRLFRFHDRSAPLALGFVLGKSDQLSSFGSYLGDKLHGFGCKFENSCRYEGQFENGFLNGEGMRLGGGKYSYGRFENGNLVEALFLEERSNASEERLRELRRACHLQSPHFFNAYVRLGVVRFRGVAEVTAMSSPVKEYLYSQFGQGKPEGGRGTAVSLNQLLSRQGEGRALGASEASREWQEEARSNRRFNP